MREKRETPETWFSDLALLILAVAGFAINQLLLIHDLSDASFGIAGCSGSGCEKVLSSRWSRIFGIPVTVPGMFVYLGLMISVTPRGVRLLAPLIGIIGGSTLWFVFAQGVLVREFCPWCLTAHGIGALAVWAGISRRMKQTNHHALRFEGDRTVRRGHVFRDRAGPVVWTGPQKPSCRVNPIRPEARRGPLAGQGTHGRV